VLRIRAVRQIRDKGRIPRMLRLRWGFGEGGWDALRAKPVPGRASKLTGQQMGRLYALIVGADPRQLSFAFALWTREMVRELIRREFVVALSAVSVGRLLRTLGLSPRRPLWRAYQQNPDAVDVWKSETFPGDSRPGQDRGGHDLLPRRGRTALGSSCGHHLGPGRPDPGGAHDRGSAHDQSDLRGHRQGSATL
jgi:transposase